MKQKITKKEFVDEDKVLWQILISGDTVVSVTSSQAPFVYKLGNKKRE